LTFSKNIVSIASRLLPDVSGKKKKTMSAAMKLQAAKKYPYAKPMELTTKEVLKAMSEDKCQRGVTPSERLG
jgi:hypothetical protein